mmetsp:Transcript_26376/g.41746  ORF Transcript_26376/g.41746 Transcript_26376/m.41746 type:complete len:111 (+) Transcript_26376:510-842(+)
MDLSSSKYGVCVRLPDFSFNFCDGPRRGGGGGTDVFRGAECEGGEPKDGRDDFRGAEYELGEPRDCARVETKGFASLLLLEEDPRRPEPREFPKLDSRKKPTGEDDVGAY